MIRQKIFTSLKIKLFFTMFISLIFGILVFVILHWGIDYSINVNYMSESAVDARSKNYINDLQEYIEENELSSKDTSDITRWVREQRYVYLIIYKNNELIYDSSRDEAHDEVIDTENGNSSDSSSFPPVTEYPDITQYFEDAELFPIRLSDGIMFASVVDFTEDFYYNMSYIISILVSFFLFAVIMMLYFNRTTVRIEKLAGDIRKIEQNNDLPDIVCSGNDEIAELAHDVNKMKNSIFEKMQKEQDALKANTELITAMSHDIRNPLTVLLGYLDVMQMQNGSSEQFKSYVDACRETAMKIKNMSDDMFQYFLVFGKNELDITFQEYDAQTFLNQVLSEHILLMTEIGYMFETQVLDEKCTIAIDANAFVRVIDNLFSNLKKYAAQDKPIYISAVIDGENLIITIKNSIIQSGVESNGIGLKTCAKIMENLNAGFYTEDNGDTFTVILTISIKR